MNEWKQLDNEKAKNRREVKCEICRSSKMNQFQRMSTGKSDLCAVRRDIHYGLNIGATWACLNAFTRPTLNRFGVLHAPMQRSFGHGRSSSTRERVLHCFSKASHVKKLSQLRVRRRKGRNKAIATLSSQKRDNDVPVCNAVSDSTLIVTVSCGLVPIFRL